MSGYWKFQTPRGAVYILPRAERYHIVYEHESLGSYTTPEQAVDDAAGGHTFSPSNGVDLGELGLSGDLGEWEFVRAS